MIPKSVPYTQKKHIEVEASKDLEDDNSNEDTRPITVCQIKISEQGVFETDNDYWKTLLALSEMVKYYKEVKRGENIPDPNK